jgi:hypothetical protein
LAALNIDKEADVPIGERPSKKASSDSGISLRNPADSGISLEKRKAADSSEDIEFELTASPASTPKPAKAPDSGDSSSDFELTLEDSARLAPLDEEKKGDEKDIFETDFEVPALEDESGSQAVALDASDTDLESSDFDLALGDEDSASEDSGSQVVALDDEEEVDEGAATIARPSKRALADEEEEGDVTVAEEEGELVSRRTVVAAAPADWGVFTPVVLLISVLFMFVVGLMSFELLHGMWGYRQPYKATSMIIKGVGGLMPWVDSKDLDKD